MEESRMVILNVKELDKALKSCGIAKGKLSRMVLNRDQSYLSNAMTKTIPTINANDLKKLCDFLDIDMDSVIFKEEEPKKEPATTPSQAVNVDALIVGLNQIYQLEKSNNELMSAILEQLKVSNTKASRFENLIGQIHSNLITVKENTKDSTDVQKEIKSTVVTMGGRLRDMVSKFK